jgi:hypothetical protein
VDLDVRKREFLIALRDGSLRPERAKEIREELVTINRNMDDIKGLMKGQLNTVELSSETEAQTVETIATVGLLHLALDGLSADGTTPAFPRVVKIGQYIVTDHGNLASVRTPEGQTHRCTTILVQEKGAGIRCESAAGK